MARASTDTLLSLDRYAQILGIPPPSFNQGYSAVVFPQTASCSQVWFQYPWQNHDAVSREDLAREIANAERDIADVMGYWPAPKWIAQEVHRFPRHHRPDVYGVGGKNVRGQRKSIRTNYGKIISPGQRQPDYLGTPSVAALTLDYDSADGIADYDETVTVTQATALTDECEVKVYFAGHNGEPEWEIRPARTKAIAGDGTFTATFWAWQLIDPDLWEALPTEGFTAIDLDDDVYVDEVDVYREYTDTTATSSAFYWEPQPSTTAICSACLGTGCVACQLTEQTGCLYIRDAERGIVVPAPASYDSTDGAWESSAYSLCRDPDEVKVYYYAGALSDLNLRGSSCEPLSGWWAYTIAMLATARLERPFCKCGNSEALARSWMEDLAYVGETSHNVAFELLSNPFGTRRGEMQAWQRVEKLAPKRRVGATAI
jgi:hypothetical protein